MEEAENKEDEIVKNMTKEIIKNELKEGFELQSAEVFNLNVNLNIETLKCPKNWSWAIENIIISG